MAVPMMAQKKLQQSATVAPKNVEDAWQDAPVTPGKVFNGTIYFRLMGTDAPREDGQKATEVATSQISLKPQSAAVKKTQDVVSDYYYCFVKQNSYGVFPPLLYCTDMNKRTFLTGLNLGAGRNVANERGFCDLKDFTCKWMAEMSDILQHGKFDGVNEKLSQFYVRTNERKIILGYDVVRYDCKFAKASLWVAEDYDIQSWFAPFWGICHPVLEFDLVPDCEDCANHTMHFVAVKVVEGSRVTDVERIVNSVEFHSMEEISSIMRERLEQYDK